MLRSWAFLQANGARAVHTRYEYGLQSLTEPPSFPQNIALFHGTGSDDFFNFN